MKKFLLWLSALLPAPRVIVENREGGGPYLARWYLVGERPETDAQGNLVKGPRPSGPQIYLHRFFRSDPDEELHSHPWKWAIAIVLAGGYTEERRVGDRVITKRRGPGSINLILADDYHRVDLIGDDSWSLFIAGPKVKGWFFWCRERLVRTPWRQFIAWKHAGASAPIWSPDSRGDA
jgi:hypothetical protein